MLSKCTSRILRSLDQPSKNNSKAVFKQTSGWSSGLLVNLVFVLGELVGSVLLGSVSVLVDDVQALQLLVGLLDLLLQLVQTVAIVQAFLEDPKK